MKRVHTHIHTYVYVKNEDMTKCCHLSSLGDVIGNIVFSLYLPTFRFLKMRTYKFKINTNKLFWSELLILLNISYFFLHLLCQFKCYIFYITRQLKSLKKKWQTRPLYTSLVPHTKKGKKVSPFTGATLLTLSHTLNVVILMRPFLGRFTQQFLKSAGNS